MRFPISALPTHDQELVAWVLTVAEEAPREVEGMFTSVGSDTSPVEGLAAEAALSRAGRGERWEVDYVTVFGDRADGGPEQFAVLSDHVHGAPAFWLYEDYPESDSAAADALTRVYLSYPGETLVALRRLLEALVEEDPGGKPPPELVAAALIAAGTEDA